MIQNSLAQKSRPRERIAVLVLGMHRSGTSALSRVFSLLGCDLPKTLMSGDEANETGHWESLPISQMDDELLSSAGSQWWDWLPVNPGWYSSPRVAEFKEKALALLEDEFGSSPLFVLKDPRICRIAPFWLDVLDEAGVKPAVVIPVRNPLEVADSLAKRDGFNPALGHLLWLRHVLDAEAATRGMPRLHTSYEGMLAGWPGLVAATQAALGISWPRLSPLVSNEIDQSLSDRLRHHRHPAQSVSDNPLLSAWLRESYAIFVRWAEEGEREEDYAVLDSIRTDFDGAAPAFAHLVAVGQHAERKLNTVESSLKDAESRCEEVTEQLGGVRSVLDRTQAELNNLRSEANELQGQLSHTQSALAQRSAEADELSSALAMARAEIEGAERRVAEAENARRAETDAAEERAREAEAAYRKDIERLDGELKRERSRISDRFKEIATLTRLLSEREKAEISAAEEAAWLRNVSRVLLGGFGPKSIRGWFLTLLPKQFRAASRQRLLKEKGLFDAEAYLIANPDVAEAGLDALTHYILHGMDEGRQLR